MTIDKRTMEIIQAELEACKERVDFCMRSDQIYNDEVSKIYLKLTNISSRRDISEELKAEASQIAKNLSIKYGSICI